jgi:hypothetical protein
MPSKRSAVRKLLANPIFAEPKPKPRRTKAHEAPSQAPMPRRTNAAPMEEPRGSLIGYRGTPEHGEWIKRLAEWARRGRYAYSMNQLVEEAIVEWAERRNFPEQAPPR